MDPRVDANINPPLATRARLRLGLGDGPLSPLRLLSVIALTYLAFAAAFLFAVGSNPLYLLAGVLRTFPFYFGLVFEVAPSWLLAAVGLGIVATPGVRRRVMRDYKEILLIGIYSSLFTVVFGLVKNHLPAMFPFWADAMFTRIDTVMTPRWTVAWMDALDFNIVLRLYFDAWVLVAAFFPVILAVVDPNATRRRVFTLLWAVGWIGIGNILAAGFMSVGPIFLDRLPGGNPGAYPEVYALLASDAAAPLLAVKDRLWDAYANGQMMVGSGISAFPSVHVGMATIVALYLATVLTGLARARAGSPLAPAFRAAAIVLPVLLVTTYQLVTVYTGMHYAIDGYASIVLMLLAHRVITRREAALPAPQES